ncbi:MAG: RNA polymerase-binding protein DksA [Deltaproteobacteria bacterium]|nr:RNA polymerase-binding protein DksA [Deltaproteobacteria bacterium]
MNKKDLDHFKKILEERREALLQTQESLKENSMALNPDDMPDEVDMAGSETNQAMNQRLRDRERILLTKIDRALVKIEKGTYGECESCGEPIGRKRLEARPVATLCIDCKEEEEVNERAYAS